MKTKTRRTGLTFTLMVAILVGMGCPGPVRKDPFSFYYWHMDGREIPLVLDESTLALAFPYSSSVEEIAAILESEPLLVGPSSWPSGPLIPVAPGTSDEEVLALIDRLNATPGVDWANPVVTRDFFAAGIQCAYCGGKEGVEPHFVVEFPLTTPIEDIEGLTASYSLEVDGVSLNEEAIIYTVRTTSATGISTIDMANICHEHPLTIRAYPRFWPLVRSSLPD